MLQSSGRIRGSRFRVPGSGGQERSTKAHKGARKRRDGVGSSLVPARNKGDLADKTRNILGYRSISRRTEGCRERPVAATPPPSGQGTPASAGELPWGPGSPVPAGPGENSPGVHSWGWEDLLSKSPVGTAEDAWTPVSGRAQSSLRDWRFVSLTKPRNEFLGYSRRSLRDQDLRNQEDFFDSAIV